jgi:F-box/leucine-rich repeat protein 2/20
MRFAGFETRLRARQEAKKGSTTPLTVPLPVGVRFKSMDSTLCATPEGMEVLDDYFSIPVAVIKPRVQRENFDFWAEMPDEIQMEIFRRLTPKEIIRCSGVSKKWHKMCFDGQLWMNLDAAEYYKDIPGESLVKIMTAAGPFIKDLNLRGCVQMGERWGFDSQKITDVCRNLENFSVEGCRIDRSSVHYFLLRNPRLVHVNMSGLSTLNNSAMKIIAQTCPLLEHLNVSWCHHVNTRGLLAVTQSCTRLKELLAGEIKGFNDKEFMLDLFKRNTLEKLIISHCTDFDDEALQLLIQGQDPEMDVLTDRAVVPPRKFRHLDFSRCRALTTRGVKSMAYNVPELVGLQLFQCAALTDDALAGVLESTPKMTHLDLEELADLTNATLQALAKAPCAPRLEHLGISSCENLGDTGMLPVIRACPSLRSLDMDNTRISDLVLAEAVAVVRTRNLAATTGNPTGRPILSLRMAVYDCQNVTWTGVREVLSRNAEFYRRPHDSAAPRYPREAVNLKCFYGYQPTVQEHTKRVLAGDLARAAMLERKWADHMVASEEAGAAGAGSRRRRRRAREAALVHADEEGGRGGRRRARSGGCLIM